MLKIPRFIEDFATGSLNFALRFAKTYTMTLRLIWIKFLPPSPAIAHVGVANFPSPTGG